MPTGYTAKILEGCSFKEFVWSCARNFGALILMRDSGPNSKISLNQKVDSYIKEALEEALAEKQKIESLSVKEIENLRDVKYKEELIAYDARIKENTDNKEKYAAMLAIVMAWTPPSKEHQGLHKFMLDQINDSISYDIFEDNSDYLRLPVKQSVEDFLSSRLKSCLKNIEYYSKRLNEEIGASEKRTEWLNQLNDSVPLPDNFKAEY